ncbi:MAG: sigma-70 family RNA polymerase sigma factor [Thermoanaerobaculia bacterium]|nr:sigma-70 family RNA polymerase sigma factor [Thermoanaerobaculia bacterium]
MVGERTPEELFLEQLPWIDRIVAGICRRHCCDSDEAEEFAAEVRLKLIDDDYAVLRKFRGRSRLSTYLTTVVANLFRDYRIRRWGKWRPSAAARRFGPVAVQLEMLVSRDGRPLDEAVRILTENHGVDESPADLESLAEALPQRAPRRRQESLETVGEIGVTDGVESRIERRDLGRAAARTERALRSALDELTGEDRLLLRLHYQEGFPVSQIARTLKLRQRRLYTRFDRLKRELRSRLEAEGVTPAQVADLLDWRDGGIEAGLESPDGRMR